MGRRKTLLSDELYFNAEEALSKIKDAKIVRKLLAITAFKDHKQEEVLKIFRISAPTLFSWIKKFRDKGIEGLLESRGGNNASKLSENQWEEVIEILLNGNNGNSREINWTLEKLQMLIEYRYGVKVSLSTVHYNLGKRGIVLRRPRPLNYQSNKGEQEEFKKNERKSQSK